MVNLPGKIITIKKTKPVFSIVFFFIVISAFFTPPVFCQDYIRYQRTLTQTDEDILANDLSTALQRLDTIYREYDFIYARHCIKALQVSCALNDSVRADQWLSRCFLQGVPQWLIRANQLTRKCLAYTTTKDTWQDFEILHQVYLSSIDTIIRRKIDSLLLIDIHHTRKVNDGFVLFRPFYGLSWIRNNKKQYKIIQALMDSVGFPGERLIGISGYYNDSTTSHKNISFYGPGSFYEGDVFIMLLHYFSNKRPVDIRPQLYQQMKMGNLPVWQYAQILDFNATYGKKRYHFEHYSTNFIYKDSIQFDAINTRRQAIGLNTYQQENRNMLIMRERRKDKKAGAEIILE